MTRIVSLHSYRGGTGKSNLTANLACAIAMTGKRIGIIDTDIQSPGIHILFQLDAGKITRSLNDYLWNRCAIDDTAHHLPIPEINARGGAIYLIPSSMNAGEIAKILREGYDVNRLNDGLQDLGEHFKLDYLFIDTHPGLNEETLLSIAISDVFVLILRPDQQDFQGSAVTVEVARKLKVAQMLLIVNKALPSMDFVAMKKLVENTYQAPVAGIFPLTEEMMLLGSSGLFVLRYPEHRFTKEVHRVAAQIVAAAG
ncbi:MAG: MinD/ParA family protein [Planctomycetes bacterium]|nr:MinD/ParA family protein [Planctomycetota bacterium]